MPKSSARDKIQGGIQLGENEAVEAFFQSVYELVARVPRGRVISYGGIARLLGRPRAARVVGWAMRCCPEEIPWQRVVKADGTVAGGLFCEMRRAMLKDEGVLFLPDGRVDMARCAWPGKGEI